MLEKINRLQNYWGGGVIFIGSFHPDHQLFYVIYFSGLYKTTDRNAKEALGTEVRFVEKFATKKKDLY